MTRSPGAPSVLAVSFAALAVGTLATAAAGTLAPELRAEFGFSRAGIGLLTSLVFLGAILSSGPSGRMTDRAGAAAILCAASVGTAAALVLAALAAGPAVFMAAMFALGLAYGTVNPPTNAVVAGRLARRRRGFFLSLKQTGVPFGALLAGVLLPAAAAAVGWRGALAATAAASLAVAASTLLLRGAGTADGTDTVAFRAVPRTEALALGFFGFVMAGIQWSFISYLTLFLTQEHGFALYPAGIALGLAQAFGAAGRLTWGWLSDVPGRRVTILLGLALLASCSLAALATGAGGQLLWVLVAVAGFAIVGWNGAYHALLADRAGPGAVGRTSGDALAVVYAGPVIVPPLLGLCVDATGSWAVAWLGAALLVAFAAATLRAGLRESRSPGRARSTRGARGR